MAQLIDKVALVAEINRLIAELVEEGKDTMFEQGRISAFEDAKLFLDTLEVKEVDLEKELDSMITPELKLHKALPSLFDVAKHFFELGLKAQRKSISIQNVDDVLKESGVDPNSKVAKMFKESYYAAIDKLLEHKGE
jgi:hypothetical protein